MLQQYASGCPAPTLTSASVLRTTSPTFDSSRLSPTSPSMPASSLPAKDVPKTNHFAQRSYHHPLLLLNCNEKPQHEWNSCTDNSILHDYLANKISRIQLLIDDLQ
ncbi:hypothetical protein PAXRUDRAFT_251560 [Paxillus rubicundulus Ve08.2h10]|uniref:Uncharacterized protein n=1 Tax=Paxillus rubicundulus Ve08.2h10 TaxID=930991 RepID=A0A0D0CB33_9AGAM|nr:hypothetical protein PAXRUDRAFT_251560 [Paxillus rubicundulus Ve08.2h10]